MRNEQLPVRRLMELARGVYASPAYLERKGVPQKPGGPAPSRLHRAREPAAPIASGWWSRPDTRRPVNVTPRMTVSDIVTAREMIMAGVGLGILTHVMSETEVKRSASCACCRTGRCPPVDLSATFLERRHMPVRVRAFIDMLAHAIKTE